MESKRLAKSQVFTLSCKMVCCSEDVSPSISACLLVRCTSFCSSCVLSDRISASICCGAQGND